MRHLHRFSPWNRSGRLPINFVNPKEKDLLGAERTIASYFRHPMRKVYRRAGKVLTWMLRQLPSSVKHFTLHKILDIKNKIAEAGPILREKYGTRTKLLMFASDVKQMFTFLSHEGILTALNWLLEHMSNLKQYTKRGGINRTPRKNRKNTVTVTHIVETGETYWGYGNAEGSMKSTINGTNDDIVTFTFEDLRSVVIMDLEFTQSAIGRTIIKQKLGCPIGGILSSFYANLYCAMRENQFLERTSLNRKDRIYGIRQVDDLVMWIAYRNHDVNSKKEAQAILAEIYHGSWGGEHYSGVYDGGLTVKPEKFNVKRISFTHDFAGTILKGKLNGKDFGCETLSKNWLQIKQTRTQKIHRYMRPYSYVHARLKNNLPIGSLMRIACQNTHAEATIRSMLKNLIELHVIGYDTNFLMKAVRKMGRKPQWKNETRLLLTMIRDRDFPDKYIQRLR